MLQKQTHKLLLTGLIAMLCLLAACGTSGKAGSSPTPSQLLQNSAIAMSKLKSVHLDLQSTVSLQSNSSSTSAMALNITGQGDAAVPNQFAFNLSLGQTPLVAVVSKGQEVYLQQGSGPWYSVDSTKLTDNSQKYISQGVPTVLGQVLTALQNAQLSDKGQDVINGKKLEHITATLDSQSLQSLSSLLNGMLPTQQQSVQNQLKSGVLDLWIDPSTSYIEQVKLNAVAQLSTNSLSSALGERTGASTVIPISINAQINLSKFNQPVSIQAPTGAVPYPQQ